MKKNILINEVHRILQNCSSELEWEDIVPHLNYFVKQMIFSGYNISMRYKVMKKAIDIHKKKERNRGENKNNRFVPSREVREERLKKKQEKKSRWSMKEGSHETIMFTEMTEDSELKNRIQIAAKRNKIKIKVQERPGTKLKSIIQKSDPFSEKGCNRNDCAICQESTNKINCRTRGCVYELLCKQCESRTNVKSQYRGQTSRSLYERYN